MVKRAKRLKNAIESYKAEIENHFEKLDKDIIEEDRMLAEYHIKEIDKSLITALERKIIALGANTQDLDLIKEYRARLKAYKKKLLE